MKLLTSVLTSTVLVSLLNVTYKLIKLLLLLLLFLYIEAATYFYVYLHIFCLYLSLFTLS